MNIKKFEDIESMEVSINQGHQPFQRGLPNENNSCYMNSVITSLCTLKKFVGFMGSEHMIKTTQSNQMVNNFSRLMSALFSNNLNNIATYKSEFEYYFFKHSDLFTKGQQEDAQEFFLWLLQWIQEFLQSTTTVDQLKINALNYLNNFYVGTRRRTTCSVGHVTNNDTRGGFITLSVNHANQLSFEQLLAKNFQQTRLDQCICHKSDPRYCNAFQCSTCNKHVVATTRHYLTYLPDCIIISVNLFEIINGVVRCVILNTSLYAINFF